MKGYYLYPDIHDDMLAFVSDDDIWITRVSEPEPCRVTVGFGVVKTPRFSPDGKWIAFTGRKGTDEVRAEVYLIPSSGGEAKRLTYFGSPLTDVAGWTPDGMIVVSSESGRPFRARELFTVDAEGGEPQRLPYGPASRISYGRDAIVVARNSEDLIHWKRYKGGTRGKFWASLDGKDFHKFLEVDGNLTSPMWVGEGLYFVSDHEGMGNLYSVDRSGGRLKRHTDQKEYYARNASSDGKRIVFHAGGELFLFNPEKQETTKLDFDLPSPRRQREPRFVDPSKFVEEFGLHPQGHVALLTVRGKPFVMGNWEGAVSQLGDQAGTRYRETAFLNRDELVTISDSSGEERIETWTTSGGKLKTVERDLGLIQSIAPSPTERAVAATNSRCELHLVDLEAGTSKLLDKSQFGEIDQVAWSPGGEWIAYVFPENLHSTTIRLVNARTGSVVRVTSVGAHDFSPAFDPDGRYLYYLSHRSLDPVYDKVVFDLGFPMAAKPFLVTLRRDVASPFNPVPKPPADRPKGTADEKPDLTVDTDDIQSRVEPFPLEEANYSKVVGIKGKLLIFSFPVEGASKRGFLSRARPSGVIESFDLSELAKDTFAVGVADFKVSADCATAILRIGDDFRVVKATEKVDDKKMDSREPGRKTGWVDLKRMKVWAQPEVEWPQMLRETWRLMRENYWREDLKGLDWPAMYARYSRLVERASTRSELSDIIRELQGEVGTSHAYEIGGDYGDDKLPPVGSLGADFKFIGDGFEVTKVHVADPSNEGEKSPLMSPGVDIRAGDVIVAVDGIPLTKSRTPRMLLLNRANTQVSLRVRRGASQRETTVKTLYDEKRLLYREWVEANRKYVHEKSGGRVGYVHIPDMMSTGYAEFHRLFPVETERDAMIVDVRYNSGGHVSGLLLEKLARKRIGYDKSRTGVLYPYPNDSVKGPIVALTNEWAGSDGDIFSHSFKLMGLGPLVGTRTWGGVVGINNVRALIDGTFVTQPQAAFWFTDTGWGVENYGTDPTIEVENTPADFFGGRDPQLDRTIQETLRLLSEAKAPLQP